MIEISVVITCYNLEEYISEAIKSVLNQINLRVLKEIIVVDDGSTDKSRKVINKICQEEHRVPIVRIYQSNKGAAEARNNGIKEARGNYIALLDGDDRWVKEKIEFQVKFLNRYSNVGILYSDYYAESESNIRRIYSKHYDIKDKNVQRKLFLYGGPILLSTVIIKKECFDRVGYFDPNIWISQDTDLWLRISGHYHVHHIKKPLVYKRILDTSLSSDYDKKREYLFDGMDKIVDMYPSLRPLKNKRKSMLYLYTAREKLIIGVRIGCIKDILKSIYYSPFKLKSYAFLALSLLPVRGSWYKYLFNKVASLKKHGFLLKLIK